MSKVAAFLILAGLLFALGACAVEPPVPTATAIPLAATATAAPRPTRLPAMPPEAVPSAMPATETPPPAGLPLLDEALARSTVEGFLARLVRGDADSAFKLFLTQEAQQGEAGQMITLFTAPDRVLAGATLVTMQPTDSVHYEAQVALTWAAGDAGAPGAQAMQLILAYERGLWLIEAIALGEEQAPAPTVTSSAAHAPLRSSPPLSGRLVFQVSSGGDIYIIDADGPNLRRLTDGLDPAWSPPQAGGQIAFTRWRFPWGVYLIRPDGSGEQRIVDGIHLKEVTWSPTQPGSGAGGPRLAFTANASSAEPIRICLPTGQCFTLPAISVGRLWTIDLDSKKLQSVPVAVGPVHAPTWSPTDNRIVYAGKAGLAWIDLGTGDGGLFPGGSALDTSASFSPDGRQIAFMGRVHNRWEIFTINADGSGRRQLTGSDPELTPAPNNVAPAWSPGGEYVAFLSDRDGPWRIYVMRADGSGQQAMFGDKLDGLGIRYEFASERVMSWAK